MKPIYIFLVLILITACIREEQSPKSILDQITLIFIDRPDNGFRTNEFGGKMTLNHFHQLHYFDEHLVEHHISPDSLSNGDTVIIHTNQPFLEIFHAYRGIQQLSFLIEKGDTVVFNYNDLQPTAFSKKYGKATNDLNISLRQQQSIFGDGYEAQQRYLIMPFEEQIKIPVPYGTEAYTNILYRENNQKQHWLDSIWAKKAISKPYYDYYNEKLKFTQISIANSLAPLPLEQFQKTIRGIGDSLVHRPYYLGFVQQYVNALSKNVKTYSFQSSGGGARFKDYAAEYDLIRADKLLTTQLRDHFLFNSMRNIAQHINKAKITEKYFQKFKQDVSNENLISIISDKFQLNKKTTTELFLETNNGDTLSFKNLIKKHENTVILVDFWASWCQPCLEEFPHSKTLQSKFSTQPFTIIYLSKDQNKEAWQKTSAKYNLENSYIITNPFTTTFFDDINQRFIPFYLLYGKDGKLTYIDAPRPSDQRIYSMIEQELIR